MELQQVYFKNAYEGFVTQATKISTLYADLVKETYKPFESEMKEPGLGAGLFIAVPMLGSDTCAPFVFASVSDTVGAGVVASLKRSGCNMRNPQPPVLPRRLCSCPQFEGG